MVDAINWSVATSADLTTPANGKRSWQDSVGSGPRESSDLTCWESLHSMGTGTLSLRMSLTKETFEANGGRNSQQNCPYPPAHLAWQRAATLHVLLEDVPPLVGE